MKKLLLIAALGMVGCTNTEHDVIYKFVDKPVYIHDTLRIYDTIRVSDRIIHEHHYYGNFNTPTNPTR